VSSVAETSLLRREQVRGQRATGPKAPEAAASAQGVATLTTRVFIAARIRLYREGLAEILGRRGQIDVVGMAGNGVEALERVRELEPDVVLVDPAMPDGMGFIRDLVAPAPGVSVIAIGSPETEAELIACAEAGVAGFVSREDSLDDLVDTMRSTALGELLCSPRMAGTMLRHISSLADDRQLRPAEAQLTPREFEVARLIDEGLSNKQIALLLHIELPTVKHHVHHIIEKMGADRRSEAVARLRQQGLLRPDRAT
jgi:two-component system nitrate/nitrite response regulator NarL